uniref:DNA replication licensing factor MCM2 n=1 Tax=Panagrolaimus davidi TaxID=227884 RepID=A0A914P5X8_9BILA
MDYNMMLTAKAASTDIYFLNVEEKFYQNCQHITIQESPNLVEAGRLPRSKDVILTGDLCDACKPGGEIEVTGVFTNNYGSSLNSKQGFPVFAAVIVAKYIRTKDQIESDALTDEDIKIIRELSKDPEIAKKIFASIVPTIYGHQDVKQAIVLAHIQKQWNNKFVDPVKDEHLADFVIKNHIKMHPNVTKESNELNNGSIDVFQENCPTTNVKLIPQQLLRKYLIYARENVHQSLKVDVQNELNQFIRIADRIKKAMIRMAEAHAKMHLRGYVIEEDVKAAIRIMLECFIQTQKASIMRQMRKVFARQLTFKKDSSELLLYYLKQLVRDQLLYEQSRKNNSDVDGLDTVTISEDDLKAKARQLNMENLAPFYRSRFFTGNNFTYDPKQKKITQRLF